MNTKSLLLSLLFITNLTYAQHGGTGADSVPRGVKVKSPEPMEPVSGNEVYPRPGLTPFEFNQPQKAESYPFISADGLHLLFVHNQSQDWIFCSNRNAISESWSVPVPLEIEGMPELGSGKNGVSRGRLTSAAYYRDEKTLFISGDWDGGYKMARLVKADSGVATYKFDRYMEFQNKDGVSYNPGWFSNISFCEQFGEMYVYLESTTVCMKEVRDGLYRLEYELGSPSSLMGKITPDGLGFITSNSEDGRDQILLLKRNNGQEHFDLGQAFILYENKGLGLLQPAYCPATNSVFLVENKMGGWIENNIFSVPVDLRADLKPFDNTTSLENEITLVEGIGLPDIAAPVQEVMINDTALSKKALQHNTVLTVSDGKEALKIAIGRPFPNPTNGVFHIYYQSVSVNSTDQPTIHINDLAGKTVYTMKLQPGNHSATVDISKLPAGTYSVSALCGGLQSAAERVSLIK